MWEYDSTTSVDLISNIDNQAVGACSCIREFDLLSNIVLTPMLLVARLSKKTPIK